MHMHMHMHMAMAIAWVLADHVDFFFFFFFLKKCHCEEILLLRFSYISMLKSIGI